MFASLLIRSNDTLRRRPRRLSVEILETRDCPSANLTLDSLVLPGHEFHLSGSVVGSFLPGSTVVLPGAVTGECVIDTSGHYSFDTTFGSLGDVTAKGMFGLTAFTNAVTTEIATPAPVMSLGVTSMTA